MRKLRFNTILVLALCCFVITPAKAQESGTSFAEANRTKQANFSYIYEGIDGFSFKNSKGEFEGLLVDIISEFEQFVSTEYGITVSTKYVEVENKDFQRYLNIVKNGRGGVFGISPASIKEDRKKILQFSPAYLDNISVLITNKNVATLSSMDDIAQTFSGMKAYTVPATTFEDRLKALKRNSYSSLEITTVPSMYEMVDNVAKDENSFCFVDLNYYFDYVQKGSPIKRHPVGDLKGDEWAIIMPLESDWQPIIKKFFDSGFLKSPKYRQIVIDNLGKLALRMIE